MKTSSLKLTRNASLHQHPHAKSTINLSQLKRAAQNFPFLQRQPSSERHLEARISKSRGKLRVGSNAKASLVLSKEQRKDPFHR
jgi:hypothetical protein